MFGEKLSSELSPVSRSGHLQSHRVAEKLLFDVDLNFHLLHLFDRLRA